MNPLRLTKIEIGAALIGAVTTAIGAVLDAPVLLGVGAAAAVVAISVRLSSRSKRTAQIPLQPQDSKSAGTPQSA
jgi:hypothetical protein